MYRPVIIVLHWGKEQYLNGNVDDYEVDITCRRFPDICVTRESSCNIYIYLQGQRMGLTGKLY